MTKALFIRLSICIVAFGICIYAYIVKQNMLTDIKIKVPKMINEIVALKEENKSINYDIEHFENPIHLMELISTVDFAHLKHPILNEVFTLTEGMALQEIDKEEEIKSVLHVTIGAK
jgi:meiotically up-regulated gene 157 (Mug157) protein